MTTNAHHLRELIKDNEEALEFLNAIENEYKRELDKLNDEIYLKDQKILELRSELEYAKEEADISHFEIIDCGIGDILYKIPENLKLQTIMEELKEKLEHEAKFGTAPILSML